MTRRRDDRDGELGSRRLRRRRVAGDYEVHPLAARADFTRRRGTEERLRQLFGDSISDLRVERCVNTLRFRSSEYFVELFRRYFGPTIAAFERIGGDREAALANELKAVADKYNRAGQRAAVITADTSKPSPSVSDPTLAPHDHFSLRGVVIGSA